MRLLIKKHSVSDVITNSSTTVFLINASDINNASDTLKAVGVDTIFNTEDDVKNWIKDYGDGCYTGCYAINLEAPNEYFDSKHTDSYYYDDIDKNFEEAYSDLRQTYLDALLGKALITLSDDCMDYETWKECVEECNKYKGAINFGRTS